MDVTKKKLDAIFFQSEIGVEPVREWLKGRKISRIIFLWILI
jgi:hypothetical protein